MPTPAGIGPALAPGGAPAPGVIDDSADADLQAGADDAPAAIELAADSGATGERLDRWVASRLPDVSRSRVQHWIELGAVLVDGMPRAAKTRLAGVERVTVTPLPRDADRAFEPDPVPLSIVHEDEDLLVVDKPAGLVVHPAAGNWRGTLMNGLLHRYRDAAQLPRAGIVHRLDKDTSGLMMVARSERAVARLVEQLASRSASRRYLALAEGVLPAERTVDAPIGRDPSERTRMAAGVASGKPARTRVQRIAVGELDGHPVSLVLCRLDTGRTHQIRVHLRHLGHPIVGDALYGRRFARCAAIGRQALHAWRLAVLHPRADAPMRFESPPPADIAAALAAAGIDLRAALEAADRLDGSVPVGSARTTR